MDSLRQAQQEIASPRHYRPGHTQPPRDGDEERATEATSLSEGLKLDTRTMQKMQRHRRTSFRSGGVVTMLHTRHGGVLETALIGQHPLQGARCVARLTGPRTQRGTTRAGQRSRACAKTQKLPRRGPRRRLQRSTFSLAPRRMEETTKGGDRTLVVTYVDALPVGGRPWLC